MREVHGRPGPVGPNTDPNADWISNGVTWSPALASAPNNCQQFVPRGQQFPSLYRPSNSIFYLYDQGISLTPGAPIPASFPSIPGNYLPVTGNWTGDGGGDNQGLDKVGVYSNANAMFMLCTVDLSTLPGSGGNPCPNSSQILQFQFGNSNNTNANMPVAGHWSPDASHDGIGIYQTANGLEFMRNQLNTGFADYSVVYGSPNDQAIVGDWTGNGVDTPGVYRPGNQTFYLTADELCNCILDSDYDFQLGNNPNTKPIAGDWLGDGYSSVGVYDNSFNFTIQKVLDSDASDLTFGPIPGSQSGDIPVAGRWLAGCTLPPGSSIQSGHPIVCQPNAVTATTTLTPTYVPTLPPNQLGTAIAQTVTAVQTYIKNGNCILEVNGGNIPLMNNDLATNAPNGIQAPPNTIFIPSFGRGSLYDTRTPPPFYSYYSVNYFGQPGWIYGATPEGYQQNINACKAGSIPTQVLNYQVPSTLQPAPIYVPTVQLTTTPNISPVPGSTLDCNTNPQSPCGTPENPAVKSFNARLVLDYFSDQFILKYGRPPTIRDILATTINEEWYTTLAGSTSVNEYGDEGLSRNYYADCRYNVCTPVELAVFLSGYEGWLANPPYDLNSIALAVNSNNPPYGLIYYYNSYVSSTYKGAIDAMVDKILTPNLVATPYWVNGAASSRPWQWFTYTDPSCLAPNPLGTGRNLGTASNQVLFRISGAGFVFEMYTYDQNADVAGKTGVCKNQ